MGNKILAVEDEIGYQELLQFVLSSFDVTMCSSIEEAITMVDQQSFDLIISDINLMGMTGLQFLAHLKAHGVTDKTPIVMCSSQDDPETKQTVMDAGAAGFVVKPFDNDILFNLVSTLLKSQ